MPRMLTGARGWVLRRGLPAVVLLGSLAGCKTWHPAVTSPERVIADERPPAVRVTVAGGVTMTLQDPMIVNDSIVSAASSNEAGTVFAQPRPGVAMGDVEAVEVARFSTWRTVAFGVGIAAVAIGWARAVSDNSSGEPPTTEPLPKGLRPSEWGGIRFEWRWPR